MKMACVIGNDKARVKEVASAIQNMGHTRYCLYTTRKKKLFEENHVDFHFVTEEQLTRLVKEKRSLTALTKDGYRVGFPEVMGNRYFVSIVDEDELVILQMFFNKDIIAVKVEDSKSSLEKLGNLIFGKAEVEEEEVNKGNKITLESLTNHIDFVVTPEMQMSDVLRFVLETERKPENDKFLDMYTAQGV